MAGLTKLIGLFGLLATTWASNAVPAYAEGGPQISDEEAQQIWQDYYGRIKSRRLAEAEIMWSEMVSRGIISDTVLVFDFVAFCADETGARYLQAQLTESYTVGLEYDPGQSVWLVDGTARPTDVTLDETGFMAWISFMADVTAQYGCVFSTWSIEAPRLNVIFESELIETELQ